MCSRSRNLWVLVLVFGGIIEAAVDRIQEGGRRQRPDGHRRPARSREEAHFVRVKEKEGGREALKSH